MSLRLRLALGLAALLFVGLAVFGIATYSFYAPTQYAQLDTQLKSSVSTATPTLCARSGWRRASRRSAQSVSAR